MIRDKRKRGERRSIYIHRRAYRPMGHVDTSTLVGSRKRKAVSLDELEEDTH